MSTTLVEPILKQRKCVKATEFKLDGPEGHFLATFSTLNVEDLDHDVTVPGAFKDGQAVRLAQWGHAWGLPTIGKGRIFSDDTHAWIDGQFNLKMAAGREHYEAIKDASEWDLQQYSYGFDILKHSFGQFDGKDVRFLESLDVHEISPVMLGAGVSTGTDAIKAASLGTDLPFAEMLELVTAQAKALVERTEDRVSQRAKEGRVLSAATITRLGEHPDTLRTIAKAIEDLIVEAAPKPKAAQVNARLAYAEAVLAEATLYLTAVHAR